MDNRAFNLEFLVNIIQLCAVHHTRLFVILADDLYTYNLPIISGETTDALILKKDRVRYIENAIRRTRTEKIEIVSKSWRRLCTPRFMDLLRRTYMLIVRERSLLSVIDERVEFFVSNLQIDRSNMRTDELVANCRGYIVEETAMALHLASNFCICDEYYPGDDAPVLRAVYEALDKGDLYSRLVLKPHEKRFWNVQPSNRGFERTMEWSNFSGSLGL